jgi:hypothetical protein
MTDDTAAEEISYEELEFLADARDLRWCFRDSGLRPKKIQLALGAHEKKTPYVVFDHTTYPQIEAHLFTIADSAFWIPEFLPDGDVIIYDYFEWYEGCGFDDVEHVRVNLWDLLLGAVTGIMKWLEPYRKRLQHEGRPGVMWAHHEKEFGAAQCEVHDNEPEPIDAFIDDVDQSIRPHIRELNELGFPTICSRSGIQSDHDRAAMLPFVMFDDETYLDISAHLFTLGDMAGWNPSFAAHGYDVSLDFSYDVLDEEYAQAWDRFLSAARNLVPVLKDYRRLVDVDENTDYGWGRYHREGDKGLVRQIGQQKKRLRQRREMPAARRSSLTTQAIYEGTGKQPARYRVNVRD